MSLATIANIATALTVLTGVVFGLIEAQRARRARQERAAFAAVQAILTPEWMNSMIMVHGIPDGATAAEIEADPRLLHAGHAVGIILEGLGYFGLCADRSVTSRGRPGGRHRSAGLEKTASLHRGGAAPDRFPKNFRVV